MKHKERHPDRLGQSLPRVLAVATGLAIIALTVLATPAVARQTHPFVFSFSLPDSADTPAALSVDQTTQEVLVVGQTEKAVFRFESSGQLDAAHPKLTGLPSEYAPNNVAIDNSAGATQGDAYVTARVVGQEGLGVIQQFNTGGAATAVRIKASAIPPGGTPQAGGLPAVVNNGQFEPRAVAVNSSGNVLAVDQKNQAIDEFSPSGVFIAQYAAGSVPASVRNIALTAADEILLASSTQGLLKLTALGECVGGCIPIDPDPAYGVTVDAAGDILATFQAGGVPSIREFSPAGVLVSKSGEEELVGAEGLGIDEATGRIYVIDPVGGPHAPGTLPGVKVFGPTIVLPDAATEPATAISSSGATFHGSVSAGGGEPATCLFQYVTAAHFVTEGFANPESAACVPGGPFTGAGVTSVSATVGELNGGTSYHYRLVVANSLGSTRGADQPFSTLGPSVVSEGISQISESSAVFEATIIPHEKPTTYRFQYVNQAQWEATRFASASDAPVGGMEIGSGTAGIVVSQAVHGLAPGTGYHVRVVATNPDGSGFGADLSFETYASVFSFLPDERRYEQASPPEKNGANIQEEVNAVAASTEGSAITFYVNAGIPGGEGSQNFPSYLATRSPDGSGWLTQGLLPPASTGPQGEIVGWTEDLRTTFVSNKQTTEPPALYQRNNADHSLEQIATGGQKKEAFSVADSTGPWVLFENVTGLLAPGAAANKPNVYLWNRETDSLVTAGILNNGRAPSQGAFAGPYDWFTSGSTSAGGAAAQYYTRAEHVLSRDASSVVFTAAATGQIYMRINPTAGQSATNAEGACTEPEKACTIQISAPEPGVVDPEGEKPAALIGATRDGSEVLFLSEADLTADATTGSGAGKDLYRYEVGPGKLTDLTPVQAGEEGAAVQGVIGNSEDGSYVYFAANGVLAQGASPGTCKFPTTSPPSGSCNIYVLHGSVTRFIAQVNLTFAHGLTDLSDWAPTSPLPGGTTGTQENVGRVTPDGRTLLFRTSSPITGYANNGFAELYRYQVGDPAPICISCNPTEIAASGSANLQFVSASVGSANLTGPRLPFSIMTRNLSANGGRILFETPDKLVARDVNGVSDVYEWEADETPGGSCESTAQNGGCLYLISPGDSPLPAHFGDASDDGSDVFFFTAQALVRQDRDELVDVYDARVGGGIPAQEASEPRPCQGEACLGLGTSFPGAPSVETALPRAGNFKPIKCKTHFRRVVKHGHERCVKVRHSKKGRKGSHSKRKNHGRKGGRK